MHRLARCGTATLPLLTATLLAMPACGQFAIDPPPASSPYWWTLSEDLEPSELRDRLQSRQLSLERLRADIAAGLHEPVSAGRLAQLSVYVNGAATPELLPMWEAFHRYTFNFYVDEDYEEQAVAELTKRGMSVEGAALVADVAGEHRTLKQRIAEEAREPARRFAFEVVDPARKRIGEKAADRVVRERDFTWLARLAGQSERTVRTWHRAWLRDPMAEAGMVSVETLREALSTSDWQALRRFLLQEVAPRIKYEHFGEGGLR